MGTRRTKRAAFDTAYEAWRRDNVGRAIFEATRVVERDVLTVLAREGFPEITMVHLNLYRNLDADGNRLTVLAYRANMTKQGMQELVDRAEAMGFVERRRDPIDGRAKAVAFSERGFELLEALHKAVMFVEKRMAEKIGKKAMKQVAQALALYNRGTEPKSEMKPAVAAKSGQAREKSARRGEARRGSKSSP